MKQLRLILCTLLLAGCLDGAPAMKPQSAQAVVFERLAVAVESGEFNDSTQRFLKVAAKTLKAHGIKPPPGYDMTLAAWLNNRKPSQEECIEMAARLRSMK